MKPTTLLAAVLLLLLAAFLRFHQLEAQSFWNDEGNSARLSERPIAQIIEGTASDVHPPLYYLLLHTWRAGAGATEFGLRALSALAGVLTVAATMALARALARTPATVFLVAGLLAAVSPPLVYYAQETRMYALLALLAVLSTLILVQWQRRQTKRAGRRGWPWMAAYAVSITAGLYTHYFFPAVILAHGLLMVLAVLTSARATATGRRWVPAATWAAAVAVAVLAYAAWMPIFLRQIGGRGGPGQGLLEYLVWSGTWLGAGTTLPMPTALWPLLAGLLLVTIGVAGGRRRAAVPLILAAVPIGASYLAGATDPAFVKFLLVAVPFLCILGGMAWHLRGWSRLAPLALTVLVVAGSSLSLVNMVNDPLYARADYRGIATRIAAEGGTNAAVILNAPNQWEVFTYYHRNGAPVYPLPKGQPDPALIEPELAAIAAAHDRLYVLFWGDVQRDPQHVVERWLDANTFKTAETWVGDVRFVTYAAPSAPTALASADYRFQLPDGEIALTGYAIEPQIARPGDIIQVELAWSATAPVAQRYKVFVHLSDAAGQPIAQHDSEPAGGSRPTTSWSPGAIIQDRHGLLVPADTPPGSYQVVVGLYDPVEPGNRLPVPVEGEPRDSVTLATVTVP